MVILGHINLIINNLRLTCQCLQLVWSHFVKKSAWQNMLLSSGMFYIPKLPQGKLWWWQQHCHLSLSFPLSCSLFVHTSTFPTSIADTLNPHLACRPQSKQGDCVFYFRAAVMFAVFVFPFYDWLMMICCGRATSVFPPSLCWMSDFVSSLLQDLIIFPDDCEFKRVSQCTTGRVYVLKFKAGSKRLFFWMQVRGRSFSASSTEKKWWPFIWMCVYVCLCTGRWIFNGGKLSVKWSGRH